MRGLRGGQTHSRPEAQEGAARGGHGDATRPTDAECGTRVVWRGKDPTRRRDGDAGTRCAGGEPCARAGDGESWWRA
jgi:hypothetical protein